MKISQIKLPPGRGHLLHFAKFWCFLRGQGSESRQAVIVVLQRIMGIVSGVFCRGRSVHQALWIGVFCFEVNCASLLHIWINQSWNRETTERPAKVYSYPKCFSFPSYCRFCFALVSSSSNYLAQDMNRWGPKLNIALIMGTFYDLKNF